MSLMGEWACGKWVSGLVGVGGARGGGRQRQAAVLVLTRMLKAGLESSVCFGRISPDALMRSLGSVALRMVSGTSTVSELVPLVAFSLLVVMPGAPSSVLAPSEARVVSFPSGQGLEGPRPVFGANSFTLNQFMDCLTRSVEEEHGGF